MISLTDNRLDVLNAILLKKEEPTRLDLTYTVYLAVRPVKLKASLIPMPTRQRVLLGMRTLL
jgi:hypothetical protein